MLTFLLRILQIFVQFGAPANLGLPDTMSDYDLDEYWTAYGERWIEFYGRKIKPKCALAAVALGVWVEDQTGETEAERWVKKCLEKGLFEIEREE